MKLLVVVALALAMTGVARAEPSKDSVALLPLDADARLEIYGQPVASEIARALVAGEIDVVVVGPKMAVPARAKIVVGGTIAVKGEAVVLTLRVRNPVDGSVLATVTATAPSLANIDRAAADVSARVLPAVREQLAALAKPAPVEAHPVVVASPAPLRAMVAVSARDSRDEAQTALRSALDGAVALDVRAHHREPVAAVPDALEKPTAARALAGDAKLALGFEVLSYSVEMHRDGAKSLPVARARVRVRIADTTGLVFDRVVATDSVVGDRDQPPAQLAARIAREVIDIARPHLARAVPGWK